MNKAEVVIAGLLEAMQAAIDSGDWVVDGACDPDQAMFMAENYLQEHGWDTDGLTGKTWIHPQ